MFPDKLRAAERLLEVAPRGLQSGKVFFCLSGAEANENAVKMARLVTGRRKIVYRTRSYHGATLGMLSLLRRSAARSRSSPGCPAACPGTIPTSPSPTPGDLEAVLGREGPDTVAAVLLEGVVGANGVLVPPPGYYRRIRADLRPRTACCSSPTRCCRGSAAPGAGSRSTTTTCRPTCSPAPRG